MIRERVIGVAGGGGRPGNPSVVTDFLRHFHINFL